MEKRDGNYHEIDRHKIVDGVEYCLCSGHGYFLPCSEFGLAKKYHHGYNYRCKECAKNLTPAKWGHAQKKVENEKIELQRVLKVLGYDPTSTIPIHQQFILKHDL